jgi:hypothetical protein
VHHENAGTGSSRDEVAARLAVVSREHLVAAHRLRKGLEAYLVFVRPGVGQRECPRHAAGKLEQVAIHLIGWSGG